MDTEVRNNSIQIYGYKTELQLKHNEIREKINAETEHKREITLKNDEGNIQRYIFW